MSDDFDFDNDGDFDNEGSENSGTLKDLWDNNPFVKVGAIVLALGVAYTVYVIFFTSPNKADTSFLRASEEVRAAPGEEEVDPAYEAAIRETNQKRADDARKIGGSAMPTPIGSARGRLDVPDAPDRPQSDPLSEWRNSAEARRIIIDDDGGDESEFQKPDVIPVVEPIRPQANMEMNLERIERFAKQMEAIIGAQIPAEPEVLDLTLEESPYVTLRNKLIAEEREKGGSTAGVSGVNVVSTDGSGTTLVQKEVIIAAGTVVYAQLLTELNSDVPAPALIHILSGPMSGARALGSFDLEETYLVIEVEAIIKDGVTYKVEGIALDPNTTLAGLATDVDHHYFRRIILPAAAEFVAGVGEAIAETGGTTVTVDGGAAVQNSEELDTQEELAKGVEVAAEKVSEILDEDSGPEITVKVAKGTTLGILFTKSLYTTDIE